MSSIETIFDHQPTRDELGYLLLSGMTSEKYQQVLHDTDTECGNIYALYMLRGMRSKAMEYLERIKDPKAAFEPKILMHSNPSH